VYHGTPIQIANHEPKKFKPKKRPKKCTDVVETEIMEVVEAAMEAAEAVITEEEAVVATTVAVVVTVVVVVEEATVAGEVEDWEVPCTPNIGICPSFPSSRKTSIMSIQMSPREVMRSLFSFCDLFVLFSFVLLQNFSTFFSISQLTFSPFFFFIPPCLFDCQHN
jgi:hypothetical protein